MLAGSRSLLAGTLEQKEDIAAVIACNHTTPTIPNKKCHSGKMYNFFELRGRYHLNLLPSFLLWPQNESTLRCPAVANYKFCSLLVTFSQDGEDKSV